ncbi:MAG TPA: hypothetical protein VK002_12190 [Rubricoccaceae bacterium]|jgi:hypothetical protein|nr:hypothetical protein [Rubricoccaceae bacterium]
MAHVRSPRETPSPRDKPVPRGDLPGPVNPVDPAQAPRLDEEPALPGADSARRLPVPAWWLLAGVFVLLVLLWLL